MSSSLSFSSASLNPYYHLFFTILALFISGLLFLLSRKSKSKPLHLPPGPPGWPIVGNLFQVAQSGKPFFDYVDDLHTKYGSIFTLKMGTRTWIIISDAKLAHEALIERGACFASRPKENPTRTIFSCNKFSVNAAVYGSVWRSLRRNMVQNMLSSSRDQGVSRLFCILLSMCFGIEMDDETIVKMDQVMKSVLMLLNPRIDDLLPILSPFFSKQRKRVQEVRKEQVNFMVSLIEKRRNAVRNPGSDKSAMSFSYLDTLFDLKVDGRKSAPSNEELVTLCSEFLNGGTDTTATAAEWGIAQLIANPQVQTKLYNEIKSTVGDRKVDEKDVENMEYLHAVVKELLRKHPPTYFPLSHAVTEPTTLGGYDIPIDANVEFNSHGIGEDPKLWNHPEKFNPDRFISGGEDADITGVKGVKMMPFRCGEEDMPWIRAGHYTPSPDDCKNGSRI
ncbi:FLAVONOID 3'-MONOOXYGENASE-RELATED [Salix purpurea]|uniref:FLAVONOID 3'-MONOOXYGENASE-RELATED n=1 Tax=Salix purpurea TaxID=77065 RepID=A0A9Q0ZAK7_SALPP|nr:FLAVONOID 3'-MONOOXYGENASE-RELATED [Salix purpurea]